MPYVFMGFGDEDERGWCWKQWQAMSQLWCLWFRSSRAPIWHVTVAELKKYNHDCCCANTFSCSSPCHWYQPCREECRLVPSQSRADRHMVDVWHQVKPEAKMNEISSWQIYRVFPWLWHRGFPRSKCRPSSPALAVWLRRRRASCPQLARAPDGWLSLCPWSPCVVAAAAWISPASWARPVWFATPPRRHRVLRWTLSSLRPRSPFWRSRCSCPPWQTDSVVLCLHPQSWKPSFVVWNAAYLRPSRLLRPWTFLLRLLLLVLRRGHLWSRRTDSRRGSPWSWSAPCQLRC